MADISEIEILKNKIEKINEVKSWLLEKIDKLVSI